ncbi:NAD(P)/FAD-dependent oxidoreductase [Methylobacterium sp. Leaf466]|uniref:NAD(P)/FAD-dependent oxidoreductase n=1 Tax=Methylobacterium sp. Leaf466 TaxID=1736386 RepID=UPI0006FB3E50|nr:NAD(P)/FAD-dependent oxidoreductase [Methylobacterium sp. Leaf466]KQT78135.1 FAD-dependent oxidoreductase [Methylobacterium sp. Leaf466]
METVECVVVGAGVVGLACARALALAGREVVLLEAALAIGTETSSRNSEVVHAGLYYPQASLKAQSCLSGRHRLYAYCEARGIAHRRCGKLVVACDEGEVARLDALYANGLANGVEGLDRLSAAAVAGLEPALRCRAALLSRETGIVDSHGYMLALRGDFEDAGGMIAFGTTVVGGEIGADGVMLRARDAAGVETRLLAKTVVTSAGLHADRLLAGLDGFPAMHRPQLSYAKGSYFTYAGRSPFRHLVYPVPEAAGLGVHITIDLGGQLRFGPDVEWVDSPLDYAVDPARADGFYAAVRRYWPALPDGTIQPGYAGIRPKLGLRGEPARDFLIQGPETHGIAGLVNLLGIESPGLTASLDLADRVAACIAKD